MVSRASRLFRAVLPSGCVLCCAPSPTRRGLYWLQGWACTQIFEGHSHYVMQCVFNPKDTNTFASASLDRTVKVGLHCRQSRHSIPMCSCVDKEFHNHLMWHQGLGSCDHTIQY